MVKSPKAAPADVQEPVRLPSPDVREPAENPAPASGAAAQADLAHDDRDDGTPGRL